MTNLHLKNPNGAGDFRLFAGLGNPGAKYNTTRHNIGFMVLEQLAKQESVSFNLNKRLLGHLAEIGMGQDKTRLLMPNTFMNESGLAVRATMDWYNIQPNQLIIIVDDIDLPLGRIRVRNQGSSGGHNGLKSIISNLHTQDFCRLRIGIGSPTTEFHEDKRKKTVSHVLGSFNSQEKIIIQDVLHEVVKSLNLIRKNGLEQELNRLNAYKYQSKS